MDLHLQGKRALVTGASLGIGRAIAEELARERCDVVLVARDAERLRGAAAEIAAGTNRKIVAAPGDGSRAESIDKAVGTARAALGGIDILVNNAGSTPEDGIDGVDYEKWQYSVALKLFGYARFAQCVLPEMRSRKWGRIAQHHRPIGASTKADISCRWIHQRRVAEILTKALAEECAKDNILVTGVNPGPIDTPRWHTLRDAAVRSRRVSAEQYDGRAAASSRTWPARTIRGGIGDSGLPLLGSRQLHHRRDHQCRWRRHALHLKRRATRVPDSPICRSQRTHDQGAKPRMSGGYRWSGRTAARRGSAMSTSSCADLPPRSRPAVGLFIVGLGIIAAPLDTAVNIAFPSITRAFDLSVQDIRWVVIAYVLTYASLMLAFGRLGDLLGYRSIFQLGLLVSAVGLRACSSAHLSPPFTRPDAAGCRYRPDVELCPGPCHLTLWRGAAHARARHLCGDNRCGLGVGSARGRLPRRACGLARRILLSRPTRARGTRAVVVAALRRRGRVRCATSMPLAQCCSSLGWCALLLVFAVGAERFGPALPLVLALLGSARPSPLSWARRVARSSASDPACRSFAMPNFSIMNAASIAMNLTAFSVLLLVPYYLVRIGNARCSSWRHPVGLRGQAARLLARGSRA